MWKIDMDPLQKEEELIKSKTTHTSKGHIPLVSLLLRHKIVAIQCFLHANVVRQWERRWQVLMIFKKIQCSLLLLPYLMLILSGIMNKGACNFVQLLHYQTEAKLLCIALVTSFLHATRLIHCLLRTNKVTLMGSNSEWLSTVERLSC